MNASNTPHPASSSHVHKSCQTCIHAKIRCDKDEDEDICVRCLRLGKECIFAPARRRPKASRQGASKSPSGSRLSPPASVTGRLGDIINKDASLDPFERGIMSTANASKLIDWFRTRMAPYCPFVVLPWDISVVDLNKQRPCACLAALAAASHSEPQNQKALCNLFNQIVAVRMVAGNVNDIDLLQGLLIHLAWAHYQPRPKRYTQHLHLATSIVCDLRLDRPSSSLLLQKSRHFSFTPYISRCCEHLAAQGQYDTDKHLAYIINLQTLTEKLEDLVGQASTSNDAVQFEAEIQQIAQRCAETKCALPFPLSKSPPLSLQLHLLELLLSQSSPRGTPFGLDKFQDNQNEPEPQAPLMNWLSSSISAVRSLISMVLVLPQGEEGAMSNIGWIVIYCGLSLAVRLDLTAAKGSVSIFGQHLRQLLDMPHTLRQIILRLEAAASSEADTAAGDHHPFQDLTKRVSRLEEWYFTHVNRLLAEEAFTTTDLVVDPSLMVMGPNAWDGASNWYQSPDFDIGKFLFTDPVDFPGMFAI
ncbi:hypothetical protein AK830_g2768 [Neonectria ditissima]|uniref:Zn(2)-C6 fungal-type domain-containing protein n=1 Tax=Neonectria ditissima TaxID=78410 RepID=A0A0P7BAI3_9HYPO|nr:hypothetical protein AK830_g2768 [Neonectria ditissima]